MHVMTHHCILGIVFSVSFANIWLKANDDIWRKDTNGLDSRFCRSHGIIQVFLNEKLCLHNTKRIAKVK